MALVSDFVDTEFMKPDPRLRKMYREKLGLEDSEFIVLYVGRIIPQKGLHHLLMAFAKTSRSKEMKLLIIGPRGHFHVQDPTYFNYLEHLITSLDIRERTLYLGRIPRERLPGIYNACDCVAIPTLMKEGASSLRT